MAATVSPSRLRLKLVSSAALYEAKKRALKFSIPVINVHDWITDTDYRSYLA